MEGFLPLVYKSLKKKKIRRRYECLSSGAAESYNISDFYHTEDAQYERIWQPEPTKVSGGSRGAHHRRCNSVHDVRPQVDDLHDDKAKQLVRFTSHRMFSCINGT
ncbi:hypothetical protein F511_00699 [Dorcoceras hygrometricum]|nr:hypothetical protein F511_00699 [Dorcoceras hygrometricum]